MKNLRRRIETLEHRLGGNPVALHMADGTLHQIPGTAKHYLKLAALIGSESPSSLDRQMQWIRDAVRIDEPNHVYELLAVLLKGPNTDGEEEPNT